MNDMQDFSSIKNRAIEELFKMNKQASKVRNSGNRKAEKSGENQHKITIANGGLSLSSDELLILGIVLILSNDSHDMWLFLALLYILM
ncbi:MAG: hypothetical protein IKL46_00590 [Clostridia bacterium]|nr:hypothetical protein [Clostridia bacterium]